MKNWSILIALVLLLTACVPKQEAAEFSVTIKPKAGEDVDAETNEDTPLIIQYEVQKTDDSVELIVQMVDPPKHGTLSECQYMSNTIWKCLYMPEKNYYGLDSLTFRTKDGDFISDETSVLKINVLPIFDRPVAKREQSEILPENSVFKFGLLNAEDEDSNELAYEIVIGPSHGKLENCAEVKNNLSCTYIPERDYVGVDFFSYKVIDDTGLDSEINTKVNLKILNYPELPPSETVTIPNDKVQTNFIAKPAVDTDSDLSKMKYKIVKAPQYGDLENCFAKPENLECTYKRNGGYVGSDEMEYQAIDEDGLVSNNSKIIFKITQKEIPVIGADDSFTTSQATPITFSIHKASDLDTPDNMLRYNVITPPKSGLLQNCFAGIGNIVCTYIPSTQYVDSDFFTYKVSDETSQSSLSYATVRFKINKKNAPVTYDYSINIKQYSSKVFDVPVAVDTDSESSLIKYVLVSQPRNGVLTDCLGGIAKTTCKYTPNDKFYGIDSFTYKAIDEFNLSSEISKVIINIEKVDLPPVIGANSTVTVLQGNAVLVSINPASDPDTPVNYLQYSIVLPPKNGMLSNCFEGLGSLLCTYKPNEKYYGSDLFTYKVTDNTGKFSAGTASVSIAVNRRKAPVPYNLDLKLDQYKAISFDIKPAADADSLPSSIKYFVNTNPLHGSLSSCFGNAGVLSCTYTPSEGYYGTDSFSYKAIDEYDIESLVSAKINITINRINLPPVVGLAQTEYIDQNKPKIININAATDIESDSNALTYKITKNPTEGYLTNCFTVSTPNNCTYVPNQNFYGGDSFEYAAIDGDGLQSIVSQKISLIVQRVEFPPVIGDSVIIELAQNSQKEFSFPIATDKNEPVSNSLIYQIKEHPSKGVLVNCSPNGGYVYGCTYNSGAWTPSTYYGDDFLTYQVVDSTGLISEIGRINFKIYDVPNPVSEYVVSLEQNASLTFSVPLAIDNDSAAMDLIYMEAVSPKNGKLTDCFAGTGGRKCTYTPNVGFTGKDSFQYKVKDEKGYVSYDIGLVSINVNQKVLTGSESFVQYQTGFLTGVHIVWVVDNSGSMEDEQIALANNFSSFIDNFLNNGKAKFPFDMYVTTTDGDVRTNYFGFLNSSFAEANFINFKEYFSMAVDVGIEGSGWEKVYASALNLVSTYPDTIGSNDKLTIIIAVSDESEQSWSKNAEQWASTFQSLKDRPEKFRVFNIIDEQGDNLARYADVARLTGGKNYNIENDFSGILNDISLKVINLLSSYSLNQTRKIISEKVYVNNILVDSSKYTRIENDIRFIVPPPAGAIIRVDYEYTLKY